MLYEVRWEEFAYTSPSLVIWSRRPHCKGEGKNKTRSQSILKVPLLFAHLHFKTEVFGSRSRALRASSLGREGLGRAQQEEVACGSTVSVMAAAQNALKHGAK